MNSRTRSRYWNQKTHGERGRELLTNAIVVLEEDFKELANVLVLQLLHDADLAGQGGVSLPGLTNALARVDHLDREERAGITVNSLSNRRKRSLAQLRSEIIVCVETFSWDAARELTVNKPFERIMRTCFLSSHEF